MTVTVHGIANCDQVRRTLNWFRQNQIDARLHDFRRDGIDRSTLERWLRHLPWDALLNRRSLTWRQLDPELRKQIQDRDSAIALMLEHPTLIRRPVVEHEESLIIGDSPDRLAALFKGTPGGEGSGTDGSGSGGSRDHEAPGTKA